MIDVRACMVCSKPLPTESRPHRKTCSTKCRQMKSNRSRGIKPWRPGGPGRPPAGIEAAK